MGATLLMSLTDRREKFDIRMYALVSSFSPLKVYQYRRGFARFANNRYDSDPKSIYDGFSFDQRGHPEDG